MPELWKVSVGAVWTVTTHVVVFGVRGLCITRGEAASYACKCCCLVHVARPGSKHMMHDGFRFGVSNRACTSC